MSQIVWEANFLKYTFHFGQFLMHKKNSGYFAIGEYVISRHIYRSTFRIYIVLEGYKLFLTSYVGLKITKNVKFLQFLHFFHFSTLREPVKQLCDR